MTNEDLIAQAESHIEKEDYEVFAGEKRVSCALTVSNGAVMEGERRAYPEEQFDEVAFKATARTEAMKGVYVWLGHLPPQ